MALDAVGLALGLALAAPGALGTLLSPEVTFRPRERSVDNWHWQAAANLVASPGTRAALALGHDPAAVSRCVRLNNYWCIKRGGWSGEIAADADGHVAFVSAAEGATVAALLLRRYYLDFGRRSALAIVSRWAPASCGAVVARRGPGRAASDGLAALGIGRTLRARWLARHGRRVAGGRRGRVSSVPDRLIGAALPAPIIALGLAAAPVSLAAGLPAAVAAPGGGIAAEDPGCSRDGPRIAHYAARAAAGITASVTDDLRLFDGRGAPTPNLARLMRNMAAVEIGPLGAGENLVATAVAHAAEVVAARRAAAAAAPGAPPPPRIDEGRRPEPRP